MPAPRGGARRSLRQRIPLADGAPIVVAEGSGESLAARRSRGYLRAAVVTARPRQWIKNVLVIAAAGAAGALGTDDVPVRVLLAGAAFCLLASGVYAINDVRDAAEDRLHPRKRFRPVAAGELSSRVAVGLGVTLITAGLGVCVAIRPALAGVGAGYVALSLSYALLWRRLPWLDIVAIAGGFVLRALAGGVAAPVALSRWFVLVVSAAAIMVAAGKRWAELKRSAAQGASRRSVLERYTPGRLQAVVVASGAAAMFAYCAWAFGLPTVHGFPWRPISILPFAACLLRYGWLLRAGAGEAPEDLLIGDRLLALAAAGWIIVFAIGVQVGA
ncbi:MAG: decaprenyl-phosphate phosphoribosyltransferase [Actinomycetota bacterium]|nr:decaprenyl-phosphate phosphoribosyltransferase [Actinomycetota bacterium]